MQPKHPDPTVKEPRGPAEEAAYLRLWQTEWKKANPGAVAPFEIDESEWLLTQPAALE